MRCFAFLLILLSAPVLSQPVLTFTDARKPNPVAPYAYYLEDLTHKLTYEQVARFPHGASPHQAHIQETPYKFGPGGCCQSQRAKTGLAPKTTHIGDGAAY